MRLLLATILGAAALLAVAAPFPPPHVWDTEFACQTGLIKDHHICMQSTTERHGHFAADTSDFASPVGDITERAPLGHINCNVDAMREAEPERCCYDPKYAKVCEEWLHEQAKAAKAAAKQGIDMFDPNLFASSTRKKGHWELDVEDWGVPHDRRHDGEDDDDNDDNKHGWWNDALRQVCDNTTPEEHWLERHLCRKASVGRDDRFDVGFTYGKDDFIDIDDQLNHLVNKIKDKVCGEATQDGSWAHCLVSSGHDRRDIYDKYFYTELYDSIKYKLGDCDDADDIEENHGWWHRHWHRHMCGGHDRRDADGFWKDLIDEIKDEVCEGEEDELEDDPHHMCGGTIPRPWGGRL
ncbi:hypothetical protein LTR37_015183 [Vermiconidia calcicola]|uniref:Uncharacterized protein n=1 Tax=Vermiconidia calcicola TaxID=1690605 RepID=A0ACC3MU39_9PEZI|nr:hypothetical protein LTR37_015183 [Vermiconidia calcicola]